MACCTPSTSVSTRDGVVPAPRLGASEFLAIDVVAPDGLAHLERVVGLLRVRGPRVDRVTSDLSGPRATITVWGDDLHGGCPDALVVRRLERLPGVLDVRVGHRPAPLGTFGQEC